MLEITKYLDTHLERTLKKDSQYNRIPSISDGLKTIERIILKVIILLSIENNNDYILSKNIILKIPEISLDIERIYEEICNLVNNKKMLFETKGNFGCLDYPENQKESDWNCTYIKLNPIFYNYYRVNNYIDNYIPFIVPLGLIGNNISSNVRINKIISPKYKLSDLLTRLNDLLLNNDKLTVIKPNIEGCLISEVNNGFGTILEKGIGTVNVIPKNTKNIDNSITLFGCVPIRKFNRLLEDAKNEEADTKKILFKYISSVDPFSLTLYPSTDIAVFTTRVTKLVSESIKFNNIVIDIDEYLNPTNIKQISIDEILKTSFDIYKKYKIKQIENKILLHNNTNKQIDICILIVNNINNINDSKFIEIINENNKYSNDDIRNILNTLSMSKLILLSRTTNKNSEILKLEKQIKNIDEIVKNELDTFITIANKEVV